MKAAQPAALSTGAIGFDKFTVDLRCGCLCQDDSEIKLRPKSFAVLVYLAQNAGRLVGKDEIIRVVWPNVTVTDESLARCVSDVRQALGDREQRIIRTMPRRGYLLAGPVWRGVASLRSTLIAEDTTQRLADQKPVASRNGGSPLRAGSELLALPSKASIAVLPFQNMCGDPGQDYFVDGMVEEIITALCRIRWLFVIARNSSFIYKGQPVDVTQVGRELGVRYVLEGSVRKAGQRVRITAQLVDAASGVHLWANRFDGALEDIFDLQDKVAASVAGILEPALQTAETVRIAARPTDNLTAYDLYLRAYALYFASVARIPEALRLLEQALERDPRYGPALAWAAVCHFQLGRVEVSIEGREANRRRGVDLARRALEVGKDDPGTMASSALALGGFGEDIGATMALVDRALALNPSFAYGWRVSGALRLWGGLPDIAIEHVETALRFDPRGGISRSFFIIGCAHFVRRRFDDAARALLIAIQDDRGWVAPHRFLAACYAHMGRLNEAREVVARLTSISPAALDEFDLLRDAAHRQLARSGLDLAARRVD